MLVWKLSLPSQAAVHPHRIFFRRFQRLAIDDRRSRAGLAVERFAQRHMKLFPDALPGAVGLELAEDIVNGSVANLAGGGIPGIWTPVG